jgi:NADPH-dependent ferric siderophore reductase
MLGQNINARRVRPEATELIVLHVLRRERLSRGFARVTLAGGDIDRFRYLGYDHWFRLFLPIAGAEDTLRRVPGKFDTLSYLRFLRIAKSERPVVRNLTTRAYRRGGPGGPEIDVDLVLHGSIEEGTAGPAATWAQTCEVGNAVAILDEGYTFNPRDLSRIEIVADETGLPATAGILASLPRDAIGSALIEVPVDDDRQPLDPPAGVEVTWLTRGEREAPGIAALSTFRGRPVPSEPFYGWTAGEQSLASAVRRHWIDAGTPKGNITFCGYWKRKASH